MLPLYFWSLFSALFKWFTLILLSFYFMVLIIVFVGITKCIKWVLKEVCVYPATYLITTVTQWILIKFCICTVLPKHFLISSHFGSHGSYNVLYTEVMLACKRHNLSVVEMKFSLLVWYVTACSLMDRSNYATVPEKPSVPSLESVLQLYWMVRFDSQHII